MSKSNYDVIIIGGGHNGLVCANILAKKNKKVLICEARERCGGLINNEITRSTSKNKNMAKENIKHPGTSIWLKHIGMQIVAGGSAGCVEVIMIKLT